jgi:hypothetical protein
MAGWERLSWVPWAVAHLRRRLDVTAGRAAAAGRGYSIRWRCKPLPGDPHRSWVARGLHIRRRARSIRDRVPFLRRLRVAPVPLLRRRLAWRGPGFAGAGLACLLAWYRDRLLAASRHARGPWRRRDAAEWLLAGALNVWRRSFIIIDDGHRGGRASSPVGGLRKHGAGPVPYDGWPGAPRRQVREIHVDAGLSGVLAESLAR